MADLVFAFFDRTFPFPAFHARAPFVRLIRFQYPCDVGPGTEGDYLPPLSLPQSLSISQLTLVLSPTPPLAGTWSSFLWEQVAGGEYVRGTYGGKNWSLVGGSFLGRGACGVFFFFVFFFFFLCFFLSFLCFFYLILWRLTWGTRTIDRSIYQSFPFPPPSSSFRVATLPSPATLSQEREFQIALAPP